MDPSLGARASGTGTKGLGPALMAPGMGIEVLVSMDPSLAAGDLVLNARTQELMLRFLCSNVEFRAQTPISSHILENVYRFLQIGNYFFLT